MAEPSKKAPELRLFLDDITKKMFGITRQEAITLDICVDCRGEAKNFKDELSRKEYSISGLCQNCQDHVFGSGFPKGE